MKKNIIFNCIWYQSLHHHALYIQSYSIRCICIYTYVWELKFKDQVISGEAGYSNKSMDSSQQPGNNISKGKIKPIRQFYIFLIKMSRVNLIVCISMTSDFSLYQVVKQNGKRFRIQVISPFCDAMNIIWLNLLVITHVMIHLFVHVNVCHLLCLQASLKLKLSTVKTLTTV